MAKNSLKGTLNMTEKNNVNFGPVAKDYAKWNNDFPLRVFDMLLQKEIIMFNYYSVDLGSGSGLITRELAKKGLKVIGVESSFELIEEAKKTKWISYYYGFWIYIP